MMEERDYESEEVVWGVEEDSSSVENVDEESIVWEGEGISVKVRVLDWIRAEGLRIVTYLLALSFWVASLTYIRDISPYLSMLWALDYIFFGYIFVHTFDFSSPRGEAMRRVLGQDWIVAFYTAKDAAFQEVAIRFSKKVMEIMSKNGALSIEKDGPFKVEVFTSSHRSYFWLNEVWSVVRLSRGRETLVFSVRDRGMLVQRAYESRFVEVRERMVGKIPG